jgi:hypothetical protein
MYALTVAMNEGPSLLASVDTATAEYTDWFNTKGCTAPSGTFRSFGSPRPERALGATTAG